MATSSREAALKVLERCRRNQAFSDAMLGSAMSSCGLNEKDSALCTKLCYGVLQNMLLCDFYIDSYTANAKRLEPKVRDILRLSVYQILFLDKIPSHAAVSEGVELCKKSGFLRAAGLVNAVLRRISENKDKLPKIPKKSAEEYLSIKYSTPTELVQLLLDEFDVEFTEGLLQANNELAPTVIQTNMLKTTSDELSAMLENQGISFNKHAILSDCFDLFNSGDISKLQEHKDGLFYVQDAAARLAVLAAEPKAGDTILDACSAPGGKSFTSAILMNNSGMIYSRDIHENKLSRVREGAERLGIKIITTSVMDASKTDKSLVNECDIVIADVPCSGLGVIRKKPDIRYKNLSEISQLPETQLSILNGLAPCVKSGGILIYSTCTILESENDGVINSFLELHKEFSTESFTMPDPIGEIQSGRLCLYPHIHNTDGFYICKLRKQNEN